MRDHPIPQDVVGYRFHIVGNMTLKQFAEIGAGCVVSFLIYSSNLYDLIKWPLIAVAFGMGAMIAFVPFEERPLDHWVTTFFKILYRPTKYFWKREPKIPDAFLYKSSDATLLQPELDLSPARRQRIKEYLTTVNNPNLLDAYDQAELVHIDSIMAAFDTINVTARDVQTNVVRPNLKVRVRSFNPGKIQVHTPVFTIDEAIPAAAPVIDYVSLEKHQLDASQVAQDITIPDPGQVEVAAEATPEEVAILTGQADTAERAFMESRDQTQVLEQPTQAVTYNTDLPFPSPPTEPNKLVGMVLTPLSDLINDAIIEVQTTDGRVVRAIKSNALGQFFVTTPLDDGEYVILVEKEGYQFSPLQLSLTGDIVEPLEIRSA